jgi:hypothetical protein
MGTAGKGSGGFQATTEFVVLDARDISNGPVAVVAPGILIPTGFHGSSGFLARTYMFALYVSLWFYDLFCMLFSTCYITVSSPVCFSLFALPSFSLS